MASSSPLGAFGLPPSPLHYHLSVCLLISRRIAEEALLNLVELLGRDSFEINHNPGVTLVITEKSSGSSSAAGPGRTLKIECGNMLLIDNIHEADIIMMETDLPAEIHQETCELLSKMHEEAMVLTYHDMKKIWISTATTPPCCLQQLEINKNLTDRFPTSWSVQRGHHFYLWKKVHLLPLPLTLQPVVLIVSISVLNRSLLLISLLIRSILKTNV
jgi:hypothetical protein